MKRRMGFACLSPEQRKIIAALGGRSVPAEKRQYNVNRELAKAAGAKGGAAPRKTKTVAQSTA